MYPTTNIQVRQSLTDMTTACQLDSCSLSSVMAVTFPVASRATATYLSRSDRRFEVAGKSGRIKREIIANPIVAAPSTI